VRPWAGRLIVPQPPRRMSLSHAGKRSALTRLEVIAKEGAAINAIPHRISKATTHIIHNEGPPDKGWTMISRGLEAKSDRPC